MTTPVPSRGAARRQAKYNGRFPFNTLKKGESFKVSPDEVGGVRSSAKYFVDRFAPGKSFAVRRDPDAPARYRCWRIK